jgi:putative sigma-54 modulation protein
MSVEEALEEFKQTHEAFMVFKDTEGNTRVLYRRKDGKFGLY